MSNVLKSCIFIIIVIYSYFIIFALTTNAIIVFIMYFYMYLLESKYLLIFIVANIFLGVDCIYSNYISIVFI